MSSGEIHIPAFRPSFCAPELSCSLEAISSPLRDLPRTLILTSRLDVAPRQIGLIRLWTNSIGAPKMNESGRAPDERYQPKQTARFPMSWRFCSY